jgi:hypothetical protein
MVIEQYVKGRTVVLVTHNGFLSPIKDIVELRLQDGKVEVCC